MSSLYSLSVLASSGTAVIRAGAVHAKFEAAAEEAFFSLTLTLPLWNEETYLLLPACVYGGNRARRVRRPYPPMYLPEECGIRPAPVTTEIPGLGEDGQGIIEVTSGDLSVPAVCLFFPKEERALYLFTQQEVKGKNIGFRVRTGEVTVQFPALRQFAYRMGRCDEPSKDRGFAVAAGEEISSPFVLKEEDCPSLSHFFARFFTLRRGLGLLPEGRAQGQYTPELWRILEEHFNRDNFSGEYYAETNKKWQCGWVGGGMSSLPLWKLGSPLSRERATATLDYMASHTSPAGFIYPLIAKGERVNDGFGYPHMKNACLTRKMGDGLYFLLKHFALLPPKDSWVLAARRLSDALLRLWERYEDFGQFFDVETGDMLFGGTTSGASVIGALARAGEYFRDPRYLDAARAAGEAYFQGFIARGITYGGPGEALCAPDSESSFAMVESLTVLYEVTKEEKWLSMAKDAAYLFSTWVMPYRYRFPKESEFGRLEINTVGSVFANGQNKHSAPGIATASGDALYRLSRYTKDEAILELLRDIVFFLPQCVSTSERPIYPFDSATVPLPAGYICERVNTSDWESPRLVGGVFNGSCWCETSLALTFAEIVAEEAPHRAVFQEA